MHKGFPLIQVGRKFVVRYHWAEHIKNLNQFYYD